MELIENTLLQAIEPITLKQMDNVKLMDRTDTKFTFHITQLQEILLAIKDDYRVLHVAKKPISKYETLYYDTANFDLYLKHHNGKLNRYKIRHRTYVESSIGFLEVKFKNNKGRTIKDRIKHLDVPQVFDTESIDFLNTKLPFEPQTLVPVIWVNYSRITLVSKTNAERVTIDLNMVFDNGKTKQALTNLVIAEVKQDNKKESKFLTAMKSKHIREGSLSKYCMAIATLNNDVKKNSFKTKLNQINKILNYDITTSIN